MIRASLDWSRVRGVLSVGILWGAVGLPATAQPPPALPPDLPDPAEQTLPPPSPPSVPLPSSPAPPILTPEGAPEAAPAPAAGPTFFVGQIEVLGSTVLQAEIAALVEPLEGRELTLSDLLDLRTDITNLYINSGYITSGAFVPNNQDLSDGVVQIQVVEGVLETVQINGLSRLREYYVRDRIALATQPPLNVDRLEEALQLLQNDPLLARVNAELTAGSGPGQNSLILDLAEADPFVTNLGVDNARAASIGSVQGTVAATHLNLLGFGDRLSAGYSYSQGLDLYEFRYGVPLNALDGTLQ
ncbi:MAG: ShlB/FhaC/HecB family hemolysin secretion/activation protein, partial [Cyanobacteria bacterium Co-bin13]|nr:ShlB/FhaC/HecB family hemolysin secretion/activation protein [Cyanobacteria bacterium Co-bin13]